MCKNFKSIISLTTLFIALLFLPAMLSAALNPSYSPKAVVDTMPYYPNAQYSNLIPTPEEVLGHKIGEWPTRYHKMVEYIKIVAETSDRVQMEVHGSTWEGKELFNLFISSPDNISKLDKNREAMDKVAQPGSFASKADLNSFTENMPAFAWLGYSIHGDEISGMDAAIQLIYHLAAAEDAATLNLLENVIIIVDPTENPDGRERYLAMLQTFKSQTPNYDTQAMQHQGVWPWGRGNHYLFDLNRDWILTTQKETVGRLATIIKYHPLVVVDAHEMGSHDNFLFTPPREPINYNTPSTVKKWWDKFSADQATAFDQRGWPYYVGEWHEQWYPGYGSSWATFFGTVGILYEQAGVDGNSILQAGEYVLTYHEAVNHQFTSSLTNLFSTANNRVELLRDYYQARTSIVEAGKRDKLQYLFIPHIDEIKNQRFVENLTRQGIIVERAQNSFSVSQTKDIYGKTNKAKTFPAGTFIINTAQPHGALVRAILDFDPRLNNEFLLEERRELEKFDETRMYEVSTWSLSLAFNIESYQTNSAFNVSTEEIKTAPLSSGSLQNGSASFGYVIDMVGEKTYKILNLIFQEELIVYGSEKDFTIDGQSFSAGALVLRKRGNPKNLEALLEKMASETGANVYGVNTGASSQGSFLGASTFRMLKQPRIGLLTGQPLNFTSFGALWYTIDHELELPHSLIHIENIPRTDLEAYNMIVIPSSWGPLSSTLSGYSKKKLEQWVESGGTLICVGSAASWAADSTNSLSKVALRRQSLEKLDEFGKALMREKRSEAPPIDTMAIWHPEKVKVAESSSDEKAPPMSKEDKEDLDKWQRKFSPGGVILNAKLDKDDWMTFGLGTHMPVIVNGRNVFLAKKPAHVAARFESANDVRLSGLLWPEARTRIAESVYATHESRGKGQVILFAHHPNFRAYFHGTRTMFVTALMYGPGMGTRGYDPYR